MERINENAHRAADFGEFQRDGQKPTECAKCARLQRHHNCSARGAQCPHLARRWRTEMEARDYWSRTYGPAAERRSRGGVEIVGGCIYHE